ncbi:uncharacterized protein LOC111087611 isoform X3 [Limulus polyphemus]|uniref:Uncharacterized protein LOC111087611 isoform X3 n=1 Tax=Limulus polyphemus TaxID=6850 RepID=A0ABM1T3X7_LIMPO|nr:uncharacterized protein LOC111087611 isoform X3 [Limulus polyphemus]
MGSSITLTLILATVFQKCLQVPLGIKMDQQTSLPYNMASNIAIPDHNQTFPMKYTLKRDGQKYKTEEEQNAPDCVILSVPYRRGETIGVASNSCLECRCANGSMFCSPKCCFQPTGPEENSFLVSRSGRRSWVPVVEHPLAYLREYFKQ